MADGNLTFEVVLSFWFSLDRPGRKDDEAVRAALGELCAQALRAELKNWSESPRPRLAQIILLDQVTRHLYRDRPESYAGDPAAQVLTRRFLERGDWEGFTPRERYYALAPGLHAENLGLQEQVYPLIEELAREDESLASSAAISGLYRETIRRFGRFPHRNAILGRTSTEEEQRFLEQEWKERRRAAHVR